MHRLLAALAISTALTAPAYAQKQSFAIYDATAAEDSGKAPVKVCEIGTNQNKASDVHLDVVGSSTDTAKAGTDFVVIEDLHLDFPAGGLDCRTVDLQLVNDATPEASEFVTATISAGKNARLYDGKAKITITDSDTTAPPPPPPVQCPDGTTVPAGQTCPEPPPPTGKIENKVASEGDSISVYGGYQYPSLYDQQRSAVSVCGLAVGGSNIITMTSRISGVTNCNAEVVTVLIGANDLLNYSSGQAWANALWNYTDQLRAKGFKVAVSTLLPRIAGSEANQLPFNARRVEVNNMIRASVGTHSDAVVDYAADPRIGDDDDAKNTALYPDGLHPSGAAHAILAEIYGPVVDKLLAQSGPTPPPPPPPPPSTTSAKAVSACRAQFLAPIPPVPTDPNARELAAQTYYSLVINAVYPVVAKALSWDTKLLTAVALPNGVQTYFSTSCFQ